MMKQIGILIFDLDSRNDAIRDDSKLSEESKQLLIAENKRTLAVLNKAMYPSGKPIGDQEKKRSLTERIDEVVNYALKFKEDVASEKITPLIMPDRLYTLSKLSLQLAELISEKVLGITVPYYEGLLEAYRKKNKK